MARVAAAVGCERPFTVERLLAAGLRRAGADGFDDSSFYPALAALVDSVNRQAQLNGFGRLTFRRIVVDLLCWRRRLEQWYVRHPEAGDPPLRRPLIIVGLPRSGTTFLHQLLAVDRRFRAPRAWEIERPVPPPGSAEADPDARIAEVQHAIDVGHRLAPELRDIHPRGATLPEECQQIFGYQFANIAFQHIMMLPDYCGWLLAHDFRPDLLWHRRFLQHLGSMRPDRQWLLKSPQHLLYLPALFETYPDAMIVQIHRDPESVMASVSHLAWTMQCVFSDRSEPRATGLAQRAFFTEVLRRALCARTKKMAHGTAVFDLRYDDLVTDPQGSLRRLYDHFRIDRDADLERRWRCYLAEHHVGGRRRRWRHLADRYGESDASQRDLYSAYRRRFGLPTGGDR